MDHKTFFENYPSLLTEKPNKTTNIFQDKSEIIKLSLHTNKNCLSCLRLICSKV